MRQSIRNTFASAGLALAIAAAPLTLRNAFAGEPAAAKPAATNNTPHITLTTAPANNNTATNNPAAKERSILLQASKFADENKVVGIAVYRGSKSPYSGKRVGDKLVELLEKQGAKAKFFFEDPSSLEQTSVAIFVDNVPYGPYSLGEAVREVDRVAHIYKVKVLGQPITASIGTEHPGPTLVAGN